MLIVGRMHRFPIEKQCMGNAKSTDDSMASGLFIIATTPPTSAWLSQGMAGRQPN